MLSSEQLDEIQRLYAQTRNSYVGSQTLQEWLDMNLPELLALAKEANRLRKEREGLWLRIDTIASTIRYLIEKSSDTQTSQDLSVFVAPNAWGVTEWIRRDDDARPVSGAEGE